MTSIGDYAFYDCLSLTSATIPASATDIEPYAFYNCTSLTSVFALRREPIAISENVFGAPSGTEGEDVPTENRIYEKATLYVPQGCTQAYAETDGWKKFALIKEMVNTDDQGIVYTRGENGQYAVTGHTDNLKSEIVIASEVDGLPVTSIVGGAFSGCTGLKSVFIPASVTTVGYSAFRGCQGLTKAEFASIEDLCKIEFDDYANPLQYAHHLYIDGQEITGHLVIPEGVTSIGSEAFNGCEGLTSVTIPASTTSIGYDAFDGCKLRNVYIKNPTPPALPDEADDIFFNVTCYHGILYVPAGAWDTYAFDEDWCYFINIREAATEQEQVKANVAYTLMDAATFQYAVYDQVNDRVRIVKSANVDESDPNHCWQTITSDGKQYLYNIGARKFAVPATDGTGFALTDEVGSIKMEDGRDGIVLNGHSETQWALVGNERMAADMAVEGTVTAVNGISTPTSAVRNVYDPSGRQLASPQRGLNILRQADGTTKKLLTK